MNFFTRYFNELKTFLIIRMKLSILFVMILAIIVVACLAKNRDKDGYKEEMHMGSPRHVVNCLAGGGEPYNGGKCRAGFSPGEIAGGMCCLPNCKRCTQRSDCCPYPGADPILCNMCSNGCCTNI
jgi:hypothetical protein